MGADQERRIGWIHQGAWAFAVVIASAVVGNACIMFVAGALMLVEGEAGRVMGTVLNVAGLLVMVAAYTLLLVVALRALSQARIIPVIVWPALALYPATWALLAALVPGGRLAPTPAVVTGTGALIAWFLVGRRANTMPAARGRVVS